MHILIIPSEEFLPASSHLAGIFQKHQAVALKNEGCQVGVISISQALSIPMIGKSILFKLIRRNSFNSLQGKKVIELLKLAYYKTFEVDKFISKESIEGISVVRIEGFYFLPPSKHLNHIGWLKAGKKAWKHYCSIYGVPDVIHAHNVCYAGLLANKISRTSGVPYVITEHSSFIARNLESPVIRMQIRKAYALANRLFVVSDFLGNKVKEVFNIKRRYKVIPNLIDPAIEKIELRNKRLHNQFSFVAIGSLIPLKRHKDVINAFCRTFKDETSINLMIAGDGDLKSELQQQIVNLGMHNRITLLDRQNREEVVRLLDCSHCLVLCSEIETFGVVLIEALARGIPIVATSCGGPETIVNQTNGILCRVGDIDSLGKAMRDIYTKRELYDPQGISREAVAKYSGKIIARQLMNEYQAVLA